MDNWGWFGAAVVGVLFVYLLTKISEKRKKRAEAERLLKYIIDLMHAFEEIVTEILGTQYSVEERQRIAIGMVAVAIGEGIPFDRLASDRELFSAVLVKSIQLTTEERSASRSR